MARIYVSSTYVDLQKHRAAVIAALRRAGHDLVAMEDYPAFDERPADKCMADVAGCDIYVGLFALRYGHVPAQSNPEGISISEMEYRRASRESKPRLIFQLDPDAAWQRKFDDAVTGDGDKGERIKRLRAELGVAHGNRFFSDPDQLATDVLASVAQAGERKQEATRVLALLEAGLADKDRQIAELQERLARAEQDRWQADKLAAITTILSLAEAPDAPPNVRAAAQALRAGDAAPSGQVLAEREREAAQAADGPRSDAGRRSEAALARQQAGLLLGRDSRAGLAAYLRAAELDPEDVWTWYFIGDLQVALGDLRAAEEAFGRGQAVVRARVDAQPDDAWAERDLAVSFNKIGDVQVAQGRLDDALEAFEQGLQIIQRLTARDPAQVDWQRDLSVSCDKIGDVRVAQGRLDEALPAFEQRQQITQRLAALDPGNTLWQRDLSVSFNKIGDLRIAQGRHDEAMLSFERGLQIVQRLVALDPANTEWQRDLSVSFENIGDVRVAQGRLDDAMGSFEQSLQILLRLAELDRTNLAWQADLSRGFDRIGDVQARQGRLEESLAAFHQGLTVHERLAEQDPANTDWQRDVWVCRFKIGEVCMRQKDWPAAEYQMRQGLAIADRLGQATPGQAEWQADRAEFRLRLGEIPGLAAVQRRAWLEEGLALLDELAKGRRLLAKMDHRPRLRAALEAIKDPAAS